MTRAALLLAAAAAACAGDPPPPPPGPPPSFQPDPGVFRAMGTGAMTPLAMELARAWNRAHPRLRVLVEPSVGSGGGARAALDGAVDLGMVSRPLSEEEQRRGLVAFPVARDAVVLAAHPALPVDGVSSAELVDMVAGRRGEFPDGTLVTVLLRERQESANVALERVVPALAAAREDACATRRWRVLYHDDAMGEALASTPGALGVFSMGVALSGRLPLKLLSIDGSAPSPAALADGTWRASRVLAFVARPDRAARVRAFLDFAASEAGRAVARAVGYVPLDGGGP